MTLIKTVALLLAALAVFFFFIQRSMLFPAPPSGFPEKLSADVVHLRLEEGYALLLPPLRPKAQPSPLLVFSHGNGEVAHWLIDEMSTMRAAGFSVLLLEYPGYAGAPGSPSLASITRSSLAAFDLATARPDIDRSRVIAYGRSVGGGAASIIASKRSVAALGLESTFSSLSKLVAEKRMPFFLLRDRFDNEKLVGALNVPVFLYHGANDQLIPVHHSERLSHVAKTHEFFQAPCGHNNCPPAWTALLEFLSNQNIL